MVSISTICPAKGGSITLAPGIGSKLLSGVSELYSCTLIVAEPSPNENELLVLKYADIEVIVPFLGIEKAIF
jgi:hypothetical protein